MQPRISFGRRRGQSPTTATSAADEAIRQIIDQRRRRNRYGVEVEVRQSPLGGLIDTVSESIGGSAGGFRLAGWQLGVAVFVAAGVVLAAAAFTLGGNGGSGHVLSGTVTFNDRPLAEATIEFHRLGQSDLTLQQTVHTGADGAFVVDPANRLPTGLYAVVVVPPATGAGRSKSGRSIIPAPYRDPKTSPLKLEVFEDLLGLRFQIPKKS